MDLSIIKAQIKKSPKLIIYLTVGLVCFAMLLFMRSSPYEENKNDGNMLKAGDISYKKQLEEQLEKIVSEISGAGKVSVMVTVNSTYTYEYVSDKSEKETETVIIGNKEALISKIKNPDICGVLIVCEGGDIVTVRERISNAVSTVLGIPMSRVYVTKYSN